VAEHEAADLARRRIDEHVAMVEALREEGGHFAAGVSEALITTYRAGGKVLLFGNGGSAADAQHVAGELVGRFYLERRPLPALALNVNTSALTAIGNDYGYADVFSRQLEALGVRGDVAIGFSTSGDSANVVRALQTARARDMVTVGFTGARGGALLGAADFILRVPVTDTPRVQEAHLLVAHTICELVEAALFSSAPSHDAERLAR
jgi:D-sedoheptulose 7-phosphate isomerase